PRSRARPALPSSPTRRSSDLEHDSRSSSLLILAVVVSQSARNLLSGLMTLLIGALLLIGWRGHRVNTKIFRSAPKSYLRFITDRSEEHTSEPSHVKISYAVFC